MTDSGSLQDSLAAMGFTELGLALAVLCCYALVFNASLSLRARTRAAGGAFAAAGAFSALTDPWVHGIILIAIGVAGMGLFVAVVWVLSAAFGLGRRTVREPDPAPMLEGAAPPADAAAIVRVGPRTPLHSSS